MFKNSTSFIKALKILHIAGLVMLIVGVCFYIAGFATQSVSFMLAISILIGLGLLLISPYPIVLFIEWAKNQEK